METPTKMSREHAARIWNNAAQILATNDDTGGSVCSLTPLGMMLTALDLPICINPVRQDEHIDSLQKDRRIGAWLRTLADALDPATATDADGRLAPAMEGVTL